MDEMASTWMNFFEKKNPKNSNINMWQVWIGAKFDL
jgi:hypothetical protein